ncbi:MAG: hypothetical protein AB7T49_13230 [Oligoflexales bacterium]
MVAQKLFWLLATWAILASGNAWALLAQTTEDLAVLEENLTYRIEQDPSLREAMVPMLVTGPEHLWKESRSDFAASVFQMLSNVFQEKGSIIPCQECDTWRTYVGKDKKLRIFNGPLSVQELGELRQHPSYGGAKSLVMVRETAFGVELKAVRIDDGKILYQFLADSSKTLNKAKPWHHLTAEKDRRMAGESLSYVFIHMGIYPKPIIQTEFVEQWGIRNQHITGVGISLLNPTLALGLVYHYIFPSMKRFHISGAAYFPLQEALARSEDSDLTSSFVFQAMAQYNFANSYAVFASINSQGTFSMGFSFYNPMLMPFLL